MVGVTRPRAQGYGARLGSKYLRLAPTTESPVNIYTRDSLAPRQDQQGSAGQNVLQLGYAFSRANLTGGEGLDWWPRVVGESASELDPIRFWDSANLDIRRPRSGEPYEVKLVRDLATFWTPGSSPVDIGSSRDAVYVAEDTDVHRFDDWGDSTADDTDTLGAAALSMIDVGLDDTVIAVNADGDIYIKPTTSDSYVLAYEAGVTGDPVTCAWWVKGRIIAARHDATTNTAEDSELCEISPGISGTSAAPTASATVVVIDTFAGVLNDVIDAGHALICAFDDGSMRSYVPQTDTAGGAPSLTIRARTQVPVGENPYKLGWNAGAVLVLTHQKTGSNATVRLYQTEVLDARFEFVVGPLRLLRVWEDTVETAPNYTKNVVSSRDEMFFLIGEGANDYSIWRYDLVTEGLFRHHKAERASGTGLVLFDERLGFCDGADVVLQSDTAYVTDGYLITPNITFGLNTPINWTAFVLEATGLDQPGSKIDYYRSEDPASILSPDAAGWVLTESYTDPAQSGVERPIVNTTSNQLALMVRMYASSDASATPDVTRFAVRGLPKHRDWVVDLPVNVSDYVTAPNRYPMRVPGHGDTEHRTLIGLQGASTTLEVFDPPITLRGIVENILEPTSYVTDRGSQSKMCMIRFLGSLLTTEESYSVQGNAGLGIAPLGIATLGVGEIE